MEKVMSSIHFIILDPERNVQVQFQGTILDAKCAPETTPYWAIDGNMRRADDELVEDLIESSKAADAPLLISLTLPIPEVKRIPRACISKFSSLINLLDRSPGGLYRGAKLLVPKEGYIMRSVIFKERLRGAPYIQKVEGYLYPGQFIKPPELSASSLAALIQSVVCCITVDGVNRKSIAHSLNAVQSQLSNRLSLRWLSPTPIPPRRLAVIGEMRPFSMSRRFFQAARALGVSVVAYGPPGHWLGEESQGAQFREAFVPLNFTGDAGLPSRIVKAIRDYPKPIDGITTVTEFLLIPVAQAAELLNLPTSPSHAYSKSVNKYEGRLQDGSNSCLLVRSIEELRDLIASNGGSVPVPGPPWIVKPCNGWHSLNVAKVSSHEALVAAVQKVSSHTPYSRAAPAGSEPRWRTDVLVEEYCDGPEVDCNFVLWRRQVLFFEVIDNFPCSGDTDDGSGNFKETQLVFPSTLPCAEQDALRNSLLQSIFRLGFDSGVFHAEARVRHSTHEYRQTDGHTTDLHPRTESAGSDASIFLIEINARPPGYLDTCSSAFANGVDLFALQILIALGDEERVYALAQPFQAPSYVAIAAIQAERSGIVVSDDPWRDLRQRDPALMGHVAQHIMNFEKGEHIPDPSLNTTPWLSAFIACSSVSRADVLKVCVDVKAGFVCRIE